jgi:hypothetical protein
MFLAFDGWNSARLATGPGRSRVQAGQEASRNAACNASGMSFNPALDRCGRYRRALAAGVPSLCTPIIAWPAETATPPPPRTLVVPGTFPIDDQLANGCWVRLYDGVDFKGRELILAGPLALARLDSVGAHWRDWDSVVMGPRAALTAYAEVGFESRTATVQPGERVTDMAPRTGRHRDIESVRVDCVPR